MKKVLIMGMGAIGHTIVTSLDDKKVEITAATSSYVDIDYIENNLGDKKSVSNVVTYDILEQNCDYDIIFLALPYRHKISRMKQLEKVIRPNTTIVILPANQGAINYLPKNIQVTNPIILLERVPQISRLEEKYKKVNIFGTRTDLKMAGVNGADPLLLSEIIPYMTDIQVYENPLAISLISSNAVIHTCRLISLFKERDDMYGVDFGFYSEWTEDDAKLLIEMEDEVFALVDEIEAQDKVDINFYDMYTHFGIEPVTIPVVIEKISTNSALAPIRFKVEDKYDLMKNRYLVDDAILGLNYYIQLGKKYGITLPKMEMVHKWTVNFCDEKIEEINDLNV